MIIGLILLAIVAVMIFFGLTGRFFRKIGVANWLAFIFLLALVVGAVVPSIKIAGVLEINVGGFIIPFILSIIMMFMIGWNLGLVRAILSSLAVASVAVGTRMLIMPSSMGMQILAAVIIGILGGLVAFVIGKSRLVTLESAIGGVVLGDIIISVLYSVVTGTTAGSLRLGVFGTFDAFVISGVVAIMLVEIVDMVRTKSSRGKIERTTLNTESADDIFISDTSKAPMGGMDEFNDYFDDDAD